MNYRTLCSQTAKLVMEAGEIITGPKEVQIYNKEGSHNYVTQMDRDISQFLTTGLKKLLPDSSVISEENDIQPEKKHHTWIIDPIDGTTNYMYGFRLSAISIALMQEMTPIMAVVYNPFTRELFHAVRGQGAYLNELPIQVCADNHVQDTLILAETDPYSDRAENTTFSIIHQLFQHCIDVRITGSAALDLCYLAAGRAGAFFARKLSPWDMAAGCLILEEAGGAASAWDGTKPDFQKPGSIVCGTPEIHKELLKIFNSY